MSQRDQNLQPELAPRQQTGSRATLPLRTTIELIRHQHRAALLDTPHGTTVQQAAVLDGEPLRQHNLHSFRAVQLLLRGHSPTSRRPLLPARFRGLPLLFRPQRIGRRPTARSPLLRHKARSNAPAPTPADERPHSRPAAAPARHPRPVEFPSPLLQNPPNSRTTSFRRMDGYLRVPSTQHRGRGDIHLTPF